MYVFPKNKKAYYMYIRLQSCKTRTLRSTAVMHAWITFFVFVFCFIFISPNYIYHIVTHVSGDARQ